MKKMVLYKNNYKKLLPSYLSAFMRRKITEALDAYKSYYTSRYADNGYDAEEYDNSYYNDDDYEIEEYNKSFSNCNSYLIQIYFYDDIDCSNQYQIFNDVDSFLDFCQENNYRVNEAVKGDLEFSDIYYCCLNRDCNSIMGAFTYSTLRYYYYSYED